MPILSPCQSKALQQLENTKRNIFLTGRAGSGKSFLTRHFLRKQSRKQFPVLASTGAAAVLIGGRTFHSFFGLGIMEGGPDRTLARALKDKRLAKRLKALDGFLLDEVSMLSGEALTVAEKICRKVLNSHEPWAGLRVVAMGDFSQLPPVSRNGARDWAFLSEVWERSEFHPIILKTMMRSKDEVYLQVLNRIRVGIVDEKVQSFLNQHQILQQQKKPIENESNYTYLLPRRAQVAQHNQRCLDKINAPKIEIATVYNGPAKAVELLKKSSPILDNLEIKKGALVMTRINDSQFRFVNGSVGKVEGVKDNAVWVRFPKNGSVPIEKHEFSLLSPEGNPIATVTNYPLNLAYALTIHKAQGATLDKMVTDLTGLWEPGQAYVALSRLRTGTGLKLTGWHADSVHVDPQVVEFHRALVEEG